MNKITIRSFHYLSAAKFGVLLGVLLSTLPAFVFSLTVARILNAFRNLLEPWAAIDLPGLLPEVNLIALLGLSDFLATIQRWDDRGWLLVLGMTVLLIILGAIWTTVVVVLMTLVYNAVSAFSGGITFTAQTDAGMPVVGPGPGVQPKADAWLVSPTNREHRWPVKPGRNSYGSAKENDQVISGLAPRQAEIHSQDMRFAIYDRSGGRTQVNGNPLKEGAAWLKPGDTIRMGPYDFVFERGG